MELVKTYTPEDDEFLRSVTPPEEDRERFTTTPRLDGYRWFRAGNVIPMEHWRRPTRLSLVHPSPRFGKI
jgi:hypothetical protein